jgi:regulator of sirC expression with transglutaminase-like and TPR domain
MELTLNYVMTFVKYIRETINDIIYNEENPSYVSNFLVTKLGYTTDKAVYMALEDKSHEQYLDSLGHEMLLECSVMSGD